MLKLIYEGDELYQLLDQIKESHFVVMDWDNHLPYQAEGFAFALDSMTEVPWLSRLPDGSEVYLGPHVRQRLVRSDYPRLRFREQLEQTITYPCRLYVAGELTTSLEFISFVLKQVPFCVGFSAKGYHLEQLKQWRHPAKYRFLDQFQPEHHQPMVIEFGSGTRDVPQIFFWDGRKESMIELQKSGETLPLGLIVGNTGKRPNREDRLHLPNMLSIPRLGFARRLAFGKLWQAIVSGLSHDLSKE